MSVIDLNTGKQGNSENSGNSGDYAAIGRQFVQCIENCLNEAPVEFGEAPGEVNLSEYRQRIIREVMNSTGEIAPKGAERVASFASYQGTHIYGCWCANRTTPIVVRAVNAAEARKLANSKKKSNAGEIIKVARLDEKDAQKARQGQWVRTRAGGDRPESYSEVAESEISHGLMVLSFGRPIGGKRKSCKKGYSCGYGCISRNKACSNPLDGQGKDFADYLSKVGASTSDALPDAPDSNTGTSKTSPPQPKGDMTPDAIMAKGRERIQSVLDEIDRRKAELDLVPDSEILAAQKKGKELNDKYFSGDNKAKLYRDAVRTPEEEAALQEIRKAGQLMMDNSSKVAQVESAVWGEFRESLNRSTREEAEKWAEQFSLDDIYDNALISGAKLSAGDIILADDAYQRASEAVDRVKENIIHARMLLGDKVDGIAGFNKIGDRASTSDETREINVGDGSRSDLIHEMAHHIEFNDPAIAAASVQWVKDRATSPDARPIDDIIEERYGERAGYGDEELAYDGDFSDPYVGRIYNEGTDRQSTEVITVGIEDFDEPYSMQKFLNENPEHFYYVLGVLSN